jgi:hypothetical protein
MNKSESINELACALSKFQGEIQNVFKGKKGYGYNYADLGAILEDVRPVLFKHGLSFMQLPGNSGDNVSIESILMHSSGQWISETIQMPVDAGKGMSRAQAIGSVISYARRYSLSSFLGIAQTDNDASIKEQEPEEVEPSPHMKLYNQLQRVSAAPEKVSNVLSFFSCSRLKELPVDKFDEFMGKILEK